MTVCPLCGCALKDMLHTGLYKIEKTDILGNTFSVHVCYICANHLTPEDN